MSQPQDASNLNLQPEDGRSVPSIPEHRLLRQIGRGASGEVWLAIGALGTYRAVKIVRYHHNRAISQSEFAGITHFEPISRLHEGLVDILHVGTNEKDGFFYYILELADDVTAGQNIDPDTYRPRTLAQEIRAKGRLPVGECVRLGAAMASALGFLHRQDLLHRDLKPSNIIFINGFPKLADIGLVIGASEQHECSGTEGFIPPEGTGTARADLYALGKILYEMSTGNGAENYPALHADLGTDREHLELAQFNRIVLKACRANPRARYRSADELMTALLAFQFHRKRSLWNPGRSPVIWLIGLIGTVIGAGFLIFIVWRLVSLLRKTQ